MSVQKTKDGKWMAQIRERRWDGSVKHRKKRGFLTKREASERGRSRRQRKRDPDKNTV